MPTVDPQPDNPSTGTLKYRIEMSDEILREIGTLNPRAAAALDQLRPMGPLQMPVKIYQSSTRRGAPAIVHEIKIGRDPVDGELILTVRQIGGEERNAFAKLKITVSPQWETDGQWRLAPKLWQIDQ